MLGEQGFASSIAVLMGRYLEEAAPDIRPSALEQQALGEIGGVKVRGYIDIVDVDGNIIEVKTAANWPSGIDSGYAFSWAPAGSSRRLRQTE